MADNLSSPKSSSGLLEQRSKQSVKSPILPPTPSSKYSDDTPSFSDFTDSEVSFKKQPTHLNNKSSYEFPRKLERIFPDAETTGPYIKRGNEKEESPITSKSQKSDLNNTESLTLPVQSYFLDSQSLTYENHSMKNQNLSQTSSKPHHPTVIKKCSPLQFTPSQAAYGKKSMAGTRKPDKAPTTTPTIGRGRAALLNQVVKKLNSVMSSSLKDQKVDKSQSPQSLQLSISSASEDISEPPPLEWACATSESESNQQSSSSVSCLANSPIRKTKSSPIKSSVWLSLENSSTFTDKLQLRSPLTKDNADRIYLSPLSTDIVNSRKGAKSEDGNNNNNIKSDDYKKSATKSPMQNVKCKTEVQMGQNLSQKSKNVSFQLPEER